MLQSKRTTVFLKKYKREYGERERSWHVGLGWTRYVHADTAWVAEECYGVVVHYSSHAHTHTLSHIHTFTHSHTHCHTHGPLP